MRLALIIASVIFFAVFTYAQLIAMGEEGPRTVWYQYTPSDQAVHISLATAKSN